MVSTYSGNHSQPIGRTIIGSTAGRPTWRIACWAWPAKVQKKADRFPLGCLLVAIARITLPADASNLQALIDIRDWRTTTKAVGFALEICEAQTPLGICSAVFVF